MVRSRWPLGIPTALCLAWVACVAATPAPTPTPAPTQEEVAVPGAEPGPPGPPPVQVAGESAANDPDAEAYARGAAAAAEARLATPAPCDGPEQLIDAGPGAAVFIPHGVEQLPRTLWLRLRALVVGHGAPRASSVTLFTLAPGNDVSLMARCGAWLLVEVEPRASVPFVAAFSRGWIQLDLFDSNKAERLQLDDAGAPLIP